MLWLDSSYPPEKAGTPGGDRGDCAPDSGVPSDVEASIPDAYVPFSPRKSTYPLLTIPQQGRLVQHPLRTHRLYRLRLSNWLGGARLSQPYIFYKCIYLPPFVSDCSPELARERERIKG